MISLSPGLLVLIVLPFAGSTLIAFIYWRQSKHRAQSLRESEALLKIAEKAARLGGWMMDLSTGETQWSHAMFDIFEIPVGSVPTGISKISNMA